MVLALFDCADTTCSKQFHKEAVYYKIKILDVRLQERANL